MFGKKIADGKKDSVKRKKIQVSHKKAVICGFALLAVLAASFALVSKIKSGKKVEASTTMSAEVETGDVSTSISASGTLTGEEIASIKLPAGIKIKKVLVSQGYTVKKGSKLASVHSASVAEILLTVRDAIDDTEDAIDDLDEDEISDTGSDSYLEKLTLDQQLSDLEALEDKLEKILKSGYITADQAGVIGTVLVSDDTELSSQSTGTQSESSTTGSAVSDTCAGYVGDGSDTGGAYTKTSYSTAAVTPTRLAANNIEIVSAFLTADANDSSANALSLSGASEEGSEAAEEATTEEEADKTDEGKTQDNDQNDGNEDSASDQTSSEDNSKDSGSDDKTNSSNQTSTSSGTENKNSGSETGEESGNVQKGQTRQGGQTGGKSGGLSGAGSAGGSGSSAGTSQTTSSSDSSIGDIEMVQAFRLNSSKRMLVTVSVDEADIHMVQEGQSADITLTSAPDDTLTGEIVTVAASASDSSGSVKYPVDIALDKTDGMLEGMSASAVIYIEEAKNALLIPSAAIQEEGGRAFVYTEKSSDGSLSGKTEVTTGLSDGNKVQISQGLSEGDTVYYTIVSEDFGKSGDSEKGEDHGGMRDGMSGPPEGGPGGTFGGGHGSGFEGKGE